MIKLPMDIYYLIKMYFMFLGNRVVSIKLLNINGYAKTKLDYKGIMSSVFKF